jgi:hypothetical protein
MFDGLLTKRFHLHRWFGRGPLIGQAITVKWKAPLLAIISGFLMGSLA